MCGQSSLGFAEQVAVIIYLTRCVSRHHGSIDSKEIIIHMLCSVIYVPFHSKQEEDICTA